MDKYFNYGFNEETWRYHAREMQERAALVTQLAARSDLQNSKKDPLKKKNKQLNFVLPHQFGGFADPDAARTYTVHVPIPQKENQ